MEPGAVTFVAFDGYQTLDLAGPHEVFAHRYGFGTAETLRRTFHRHVGIAPSDYRDRFVSALSAQIPRSPQV